MRDVNRGLAELSQKVRSTRSKWASTLPKHVDVERFEKSFMMAARDNTELMKCSPASLFSCITDAAAMGLELGGPMSTCYMIPFRDSRKGTTEAQLVIGYKGMIELMRRSGDVDQIDFQCVYQGDKFKSLLGDDAGIYHEPSDDCDRERKPITHCYVIIRLRNGAKQRLVWPASRINKHKEQFSRGWNRSDSPWQTHWETMAFKTMIRHMFGRGLIPVSAEVQRHIERDVDRLEQMATTVESAVEEIPDFVDSQQEQQQQQPEHTPEQQPTDDDRLSDIEEATIITRDQIEHAETAAEVAKVIKEMPSKLPPDVREELAVFAAKRQEKMLAKKRKDLG